VAEPPPHPRTVWIRAHPLLRDALLTNLKLAASRTLEALKTVPEHAGKKYTLEVADISDSLNAFEITGPKSSQVIAGALKLAARTKGKGKGEEVRDVRGLSIRLHRLGG